MDATFIQQNQIVERYLMGKLPLKGAQDFERWCRENPDTVAELGLSERINSALRLLDAAGEPLPWTEKPQAAWQKLPVFAGVAFAAFVGLAAAVALFASGQRKSGQIAALERQLAEQPLLPAQSTRPVTIQPSRNGPSSRSDADIGGSRAELAELRFDLGWSKYNHFIVTVERVNQGRVAVLHNLGRDSNGHVRVALNSSALGPGDYAVQIEGLDLRRGSEAQGWARFRVSR